MRKRAIWKNSTDVAVGTAFEFSIPLSKMELQPGDIIDVCIIEFQSWVYDQLFSDTSVTYQLQSMSEEQILPPQIGILSVLIKQRFLLGGILLVGSLAFGTYYMRSRTSKRRDRLEENIIELAQGKEPISLTSLALEYRLSNNEIRQALDTGIQKGIVEGIYTKDGTQFMSYHALKEFIKQKLEVS